MMVAARRASLSSDNSYSESRVQAHAFADISLITIQIQILILLYCDLAYPHHKHLNKYDVNLEHDAKKSGIDFVFSTQFETD